MELAKYLKTRPVATQEELATLRAALLSLTLEDIFGEAFVETMNEPLIMATYDEDFELNRLAQGLVATIQSRWPVQDTEDPWASRTDGDADVFSKHETPLTHDTVSDQREVDEDGENDDSSTVVQPAPPQTLKLTIQLAVPPAMEKPEPSLADVVRSKRHRQKRACARPQMPSVVLVGRRQIKRRARYDRADGGRV